MNFFWLCAFSIAFLRCFRKLAACFATKFLNFRSIECYRYVMSQVFILIHVTAIGCGYIFVLTLSFVVWWSLLLLVGSVKVNVEPYPSFDYTESEPCSCSMILLQMLSPRPCPYPFCFKLAGLVDLNEGLNIRSYSSSDIPMPLSVTSIFNSTSSESSNSCKLIRTSIESCGFVNFRAFDRRLIVTCWILRQSNSNAASYWGLDSFIITSLNLAYWLRISTIP